MPGRTGIRLSGWLKHSFIDFPGTVATVLFFGGCNLRCPYCHNPALVNGDADDVDFDEVMAYLERRKGIIEGVVLSGGEPTLHQNDLLTVADHVRALGLKVKLDTNGLLPDVTVSLTPDYLALDLKTLPSRYRELGGEEACGAALTQSLAIVKLMGTNAEVRITVAAPYVGDAEIEAFMALLQGVHTVYLQPVRLRGELLDPLFAQTGTVPIEIIRRYRDRLAGVVERCEIRGDAG